MNRATLVTALVMASLAAAGCATSPSPAGADAAAEPLVHEYRTGSLMVQKDKHVTTEQERQDAREVADKIRSMPAGAPGRTP